MNKEKILAEIKEIESKMDDILDMPDEFQTDDIWDEYADLEIKLGVLESLLED